jgi:WD40 repeat protein
MLRAWDLLEEEFLWEDNLGHKFSDSICDMSYKSLYELDDPIIITATQDDCHIILGFRIYNEQSKKDILQFVSLSRHLEDCEWNLLTDDNDDFIKSILVSEDAEIAISATFGGELRILDLTNSEIAHLLKRERVINALALDKNNSRIVLAVSTMFNEGIIKICSLADPNREIIINNLHTKTINSIKITSDGKWLISVSDDQTLVVSDLNKECEFIARFIAESPLLTCDITPDGNTIIAGDKLGNLHFLRIKGN